MSWFIGFIYDHQSIATSIFLMSAVAITGLIIGSINIRGVSLGIGGVIFSGILFGHYGLTIDHTILEFCRDFGLILFVYAIGLSVGPGIVDALKSEGLALNICAASIVLLGALLTVCISLFANVAPPIAVGMFSGAVTNTPSLAAATQALQDKANAGKISAEAAYEALGQIDPAKQAQYAPLSSLGEEKSRELVQSVAKMPGLGYAVTYPFGVIGTILGMLLVRFFFRIDVGKELDELSEVTSNQKEKLQVVNLQVRNNNLFGKQVSDIPALSKLSVVISRLLHDGHLTIARPNTKLHEGDVFIAVGTKEDLEQLELIVGGKADIDLRSVHTEITTRRILVTDKAVVGTRIGDLGILSELDVRITRVRRADQEFAPNRNVTLHYADSVVAVGTPDAVAALGNALGDCNRSLEHPDVIVLFIGILLGVILGSIPLAIPGMPAPVKLGMAGGPLVVAIILSRMRRVGNAVSYMSNSAKIILREMGIVLFLSAVGLKAGENFVQTLLKGNGFQWMLLASLITLVPVLVVTSFMRYKYKLNYATICGLIAGAMTDPPALAFAQNSVKSDTIVISYAAVYPLTMILRIVVAQLIAMLL